MNPLDSDLKLPRRIFRSLSFWFSIASLSALLLISFFLPIFSETAPMSIDLSGRFMGPTLNHPMGQDEFGASVLLKIIWGARLSLGLSLSVVALSILIGVIVGSYSAWYGGILDLAFMRLVDFLSAFPGFLLALALVSIAGPSWWTLFFALSITAWTGVSRLVRAEVLVLKESDFIEGAKALGASTPRIWVFHLWPQLIGLVLIQASFGLSGVIVSEAGLSFLGLGIESSPSWGALLSSGRKYLIEAPHITIFTGICLVWVVVSLNSIAENLREFFSRRGPTD